MVPPPVTPSPHRFVIKKSQKAPPAAAPQPQAQAHQQWPSIQQKSQTHQTKRQQFNEAPRFSFTTPQRSPVLSRVVGDHTANSVPRVRLASRLEDVIDDLGDEESGTTLLSAGEYYQTRRPNELSDPNEQLEQDPLYEQEVVETDHDLPARDPKRRRLSPVLPALSAQSAFEKGEDNQGNGCDYDVDTDMDNPRDANVCGQLPDPDHDFEDLLSSVNTIISSTPQLPTPRSLQTNPSTAAGSNAHRFLPLSTPRPAPHATPQAFTEHQNTPFIKPPRFRLPAEEERTGATPGEPLPDAFSPQRRGQKFLHGGLASEVVGWVMNLESNTTTKMEMTSTLGSTEKWPIKILIEEVRGAGGTGMTLVRGRLINARDDSENAPTQKIILAGAGASDAFGGQSKVEVGKLVGIKWPVWEVLVDEQKWGVAVTWMVLD